VYFTSSDPICLMHTPTNPAAYCHSAADSTESPCQ
jgi:hypothetical protein